MARVVPVNSPAAVSRAVGGSVLAAVATAVGAVASAVLPLTGLAWNSAGFAMTESWEDGEGHFLVAAALFCGVAWLVLLGLSLTICLGDKLGREAWQTGLALTVGIVSVIVVAGSFLTALSAIDTSVP